MTPDGKLHTDLNKLFLSKHPEEEEHPAWIYFVRAMENKQYGYEAILSAWAWFAEGWEMRPEWCP